MTNNPGLLLVISGPSGAGKSTALRAAMAQNPDMVFSVSATTRAPREGETAQSYRFLTREEFIELEQNGLLLEYAEFAGNYYGTPLKPVLETIESGKVAVLDIEVKGALQVREKMPDCATVFLCPSDAAEAERRLRLRNTETEEKIRCRTALAAEQLKYARQYDYVVFNDVLDEAVRSILAIVEAERRKVSRQTVLW